MASAYGLNGGTARCHLHFKEFMKCYNNVDDPMRCINQRDDYMECLHRKKELARAKQIKDHHIQTSRAKGEDRAAAAERLANGVKTRLGLVDPDEDGKGKEKGK